MTRIGGALNLEPGELDLLATAALAATGAARGDDAAALILAEMAVALRERVATGRVHVLRPVTPTEARRLAQCVSGKA